MDNPDATTVSDILKEYDTNTALFQDFKNSCSRLIAELLRLEKISVHSVTARVKDRPKLAEKLGREGKNYSCLADVTDVVGVRVITHFEDEIDKIGSLVEKEFIVDPEKSVDKRKVLDPDRFGYLSLHYICALSPDRLKLAENRRFKNLVCEIQIRSILQHAWAEIEHDLGYKSGHGVPVPIRRRFSRLAGLLEVADQEFAAIRNDLGAYESRVKTEVNTAPAQIGIDKISLKATFNQNPLIRALDEQFAKSINVPLDENNSGLIRILSEGLSRIGISTIEQLVGAVEKHRELLVFEVTENLHEGEYPSLPRGLSALHLFWVVIGLRGGEQEIMRACEELRVGTPEINPGFARKVMLPINEFHHRDKVGH